MSLRNQALTPRERKLRLIDCLVYRARRGSIRSLTVLLGWFDPLILKTASRIHHRVHGRIAIDELHEAGKQEFRKLTLLTYIPNGKAHFNRYAESALHAELWKLFRPLTKETPTLDEDLDVFTSPEQETHQDAGIDAIARYSLIVLNQSEKKVITDCVINGRTCVAESKIMHLSKVRISQIKSHALKKLKAFLIARGIKKEDIQ